MYASHERHWYTARTAPRPGTSPQSSSEPLRLAALSLAGRRWQVIRCRGAMGLEAHSSQARLQEAWPTVRWKWACLHQGRLCHTCPVWSSTLSWEVPMYPYCSECGSAQQIPEAEDGMTFPTAWRSTSINTIPVGMRRPWPMGAWHAFHMLYIARAQAVSQHLC